MKLFKKKIFSLVSVLTLAITLCLVAVMGIYDYVIPNRVSFFEGEELPVFLNAEASSIKLLDSKDGSSASYKLFNVLPLKSVEAISYKDKSLIPGGMPFGIKFFTDGLLISGFNDVKTKDGSVNPAKDAGLKANDIITKINGKSVRSTTSLSDAVSASEGKEITITYLRGGKEYNTSVTPVISENEGAYKTGIIIRDSGAGIGTVSFIDPENGFFAGLGHGICEGENGTLIPISRGAVLDVTISGIEKGLSGAPGEIRGYFNQKKLGSMIKNSDCGVYGVFTDIPSNPLSKPLKIGLKSEICEGDAKIYCTLGEEGIKEYTVTIYDINRNADGGKCFSIKVTDAELLEKTGGIIQGMSGSPIIQNGKLVGAVTHVLVNDPTRGYGIFIENMLAAADAPTENAA